MRPEAGSNAESEKLSLSSSRGISSCSDVDSSFSSSAELEKEESTSEQLEIPLEEDKESFSDSALEPASGLIGADEPPDDPIKDDQDG